MANKNYFSTRISISERAAEVGLPPNTSTIQRVGSLSARLVDIGTYPAQGDNSFTPGPSKGLLSMTYDGNNDLTGSIKLQDPSNTLSVVGVSVPPVGTMGYFPVDKVPDGWIVIGDPYIPYKHKTTIGYIGGNPLNPIYANTEFTEIYEILKGWNLIESERKNNLGASFNTKDPFKGYFIRCLNPDATGVDAGAVPLQTQSSSMTRHSHDGYDLPTFKEPHSLYEANGTFAVAPTYYNFNLNRSEYQISETLNPAIPANTYNLDVTTRPFNDIGTMHYRDRLIIRSHFSGVNNSANTFTLGLYDYDGNLQPIDDREVEYSIRNVPGAPTIYPTFNAFDAAFMSRRKSAGAWIPEVTFKPKKLLNSEIYLIVKNLTGTFTALEKLGVKEKFNLISYENSPIIDRGRIPFHDEILEDMSVTTDPVGAIHITPATPLSRQFSYGTNYYYNYKWMFSQTWGTLNDGTMQINYENFNKPPFHNIDANNVIHSVTHYDNHIHTRVETYYRSIIGDPADDSVNLYGRVSSPQYPSIPTGVGSDYWFSGGPNKSILPYAPGIGGPTTVEAQVNKPGQAGWIGTDKTSDSYSKVQAAKGYVTGSNVGKNSPMGDRTTGDSAPGTTNPPFPANDSRNWIDETNLTYETPYWLRAYGDFITVWPKGSEEYVRFTGTGAWGISANKTFLDVATDPNLREYTVRSHITSSSWNERTYASHNAWPAWSGWHHQSTTYSYYTTRVGNERVWSNPAINPPKPLDAVNYLDPDTQQLVRRTYRTRKIGPRETFALRRYLVNAEAAVHILKSNPGTPLGTEYYNTGDDGNLAQRTTFEGNHDHAHVHDESFYRGEDQFRPINIALRLCIKI